MTTKLVLPFPPSANRYWRHNRGVIHRSKEAEDYLNAVAIMCRAYGVQPVDYPVCATFVFYRPAKRGDLDNMLKVIIDSLRGFAYMDDKQIIELHAKRYEDPGDPRVEIIIE